jgi:predicted O-methyltransferase YrrM
MGSISAEVSEAVVRHYDVSRNRRIVDVGGSEGVLLSALLTAAPAATGVLFDLPEVIAGARDSLTAGDHGERIELVGGDFFDEVPAGGELYVLKSVLHDWEDEQALRILQNVHRASAPGGSLAVIEALLPSEPAPSFTHLMNLLMLTVAGGRERTLEDYQALFDQAGYRLKGAIPAPSSTAPWSVIEAIRQ